MDNLNELQNLLNQVENIVKKYDDLALQSGEKFNVFDIIGIRNDEVRMHSAMLANLLDAQGSHGMKGKFLELFIKTIEDKKSLDNNNFKDKLKPFRIDNSSCIKEEHNYENGRIDLVIKKDDGECPFLIENKINAKEQYNQLIKYNNAYPDANIIYLTLYGDAPSTHIDNDGTDISEKVYCISYKTDILNWLEICHKEASNKPLIREGIKHYINLIKIITNQTMDNNKDNELRKLINENVNAYFEISKIYDLIGDFNFKYTLNYFIKLYDILDIYNYKEPYKLVKGIGTKGSRQVFFKNDIFEFDFFFCDKLDNLCFRIWSSEKISDDFIKKYNETFNKSIKRLIKENGFYKIDYSVDKYYNNIKNLQNICDEKNIEEFAKKINAIKEYVLNH